MNKVFLGGTWSGSTWREELIEMIYVDYFNPIVEDWIPEDQAIEEEEKAKHCNIHLYVITHEMSGVFSIAEAVESAMTRNKFTILQIVPDGFSEPRLKSLDAVRKMIIKHGGVSFFSNQLKITADLINQTAL